jgi:hypothetical protein
MFKCELCGKKMAVTEIDRAENIAWVCCPDFFEGNDEHDSYPVELTKEIEELFLQQG